MSIRYHRIVASVKSAYPDAVGHRVMLSVQEDLGLQLKAVRTTRVLTLIGTFSDAECAKVRDELFIDPVVENAKSAELENCTHVVEVSFLAGVTDNVARSAKEGVELLLERTLTKNEEIRSSTLYALAAQGLDEKALMRVFNEVLHNPFIERIEVLKGEDFKAGKDFAPPLENPHFETPATGNFNLSGMDGAALLELSKKMGLALSIEEMQTIQAHYEDDTVKEARKKAGFPAGPTDLELECYAQTWSEHCKHKIFSAFVNYEENGRTETFKSLFKSFIAAPTFEIMKRRDDIVSVFSDNAGVFTFDEDYELCIKAETHNSPSALDPYGGAMTGIVGVNRDVLGTGRGFLPICNTDIFCFAPPNYAEPIPGRLHHPKRIFRGVHRGVKDGGNESGIPTVNGSISFDNRFLGKPLVFCGTLGVAPRFLQNKPTSIKWIHAGDKVVMIGGLIGKDGIHGATFSSEGLSSASPTSAVQIGDPITQKRMTDFMIEARDLGLYDFLTDNGAGGLASSIGEMAREIGGARLDLSLAPLKYSGLAPWEIFLSEAQERMSLSVPEKDLNAFMALAKKRGVLATCLGEFTDKPFLELFFGKEPVARLDMDFLHEGLPPLHLEARWNPVVLPEPRDEDLPEMSEDLGARILRRFNICSKEDWVRQYDHEVQGMSVIKPFSGVEHDAPSDAAVLRPRFDSYKGLALSHGLLPRYSDIDAYHMAANVIDEAMRSIVAVGADPDMAVGLDNFCWPDPVPSASNPDAHHKMAQLVRACRAVSDVTKVYSLPCISGKDSMKNDFVDENGRISIPPTLLFTAASTLPDVRKAISMDFKQAGDIIYLLGDTLDELGASEFYHELGFTGNKIPVVRPQVNLELYRSFFGAAKKGLIASAHDLSEGGLWVSLCESCFGGRLGATVALGERERNGLGLERFLFSESAGRLLVSVSPKNESAFLQAFAGKSIFKLGLVSENYQLNLAKLAPMKLEPLYQSWRTPLKEDA